MFGFVGTFFLLFFFCFWILNYLIRRDSINTPDSINSDKNLKASPDDEEADTDLETDRLLGQQRQENIGNLEKAVSLYLQKC